MRILIIDDMHPSIVSLLENDGHHVNYKPNIVRKEILEIIGSYEGLIIRSKTPINRELIEFAPQLQFIGRAGAGLDNIDMGIMEEKGIKVLNAPEGNRDAVGEHAVGMLLALFNHFSRSDQQVRKGIWHREENRGEEMAGKTIGIFGFGNMGKAFARKLLGFDVNILAYDKYISGFSDFHVQECSFEKIQEDADILSLHVPLTAETRNFFTIELLEKFRKPIYLINTARGEMISFDTLNEALERGILRGAVLDVLENERLNSLSHAQQLSFDKLASRSNVLFSPHVAGWTFQSYEKINQVLAKKIKDVFH